MSISDKFNKLGDKIGDPPGPTTPDRAKDATLDKASLNEAPVRTAPGHIDKGARTVKEAEDPR